MSWEGILKHVLPLFPPLEGNDLLMTEKSFCYETKTAKQILVGTCQVGKFLRLRNQRWANREAWQYLLKVCFWSRIHYLEFDIPNLTSFQGSKK